MKKLLFALAVCLAGAMHAHGAVTGLRVVPTTGESVMFLFSDQPELLFEAGSLTVTTSTAEATPVTFEMDGIKFVDFVDVSGVDEVSTLSGIKIVTESNRIVFEGVGENIPVGVFAIDGKVLMQTTASNQFVLDKSSVPAGICIVKIGTFAAKVAVK
jgi:hypothetical protein